MSDATRPLRHLDPRCYRRPLPPREPLISQDEMARRIEAIRLEDAPAICPVCQSTVGEMARARQVIRLIREAS